MKQLDDQTFDRDVDEYDLSLIMFSAPWAGPCNLVRPAFEEVSARFGNRINFAEFNLDDNPKTPSRLGIKQVPLFMVLRHGTPANLVAGAVQPEVLESLCEELLDD